MVSSSQDQGSKKRKSLSGAADTASSPNKKANSAASPSSPSKKGKEKVVPGSALNSNDNAASSSKPRPRPRPSAGSAANGDAPSSSFSQEADGSSGKVEKRLSRGQKPSSGEVVIRSSAEQPIGPVLASFNDFEPPSTTALTLYTAPAPYTQMSIDGDEDSSDTRLLLAGETHKMRYLSTNGDYAHSMDGERGKARVREYDGEYMLGLYDPSTSSVTLRRAPLLTMHRSVKALAELAPSAVGAADYGSRKLARRDLGDLFGNRKMRAKASNEDRMKVDGSTEGMQRIMKQVTAGISASAHIDGLLQSSQTGSVSATQDGEGAVSNSGIISVPVDALRTIPRPNTEAKHPAEAYPIDAIVPSHVFKALEIDLLLNAASEDELAKALPGPGPAHKAYIRDHVWDAVKRCKNPGAGDGASKAESGILKTSNSRDRVRMALYASLLWAFRNNVKSLDDREKLSGKLKLKGSGKSAIVLEDLLSRFTEEDLGSKKHRLTRESETKLLVHMFAIFLHLDNFSSDAAKLSRDLELPMQRIQDLFKSLGCSNSQIVVSAAGQDGKKERRMVLKVPLTFPKPKRGAPKR